MNQEKIKKILDVIAALTTVEGCKAFMNEFKKYEHFLEGKEVVRIKEEILSQIIKIKGWGK